MSDAFWASPLGHELHDRWMAFTAHFPCEPHVRSAAYRILCLFYESEGRFYHTLDHVRDCLDRFEEMGLDLAEAPDTVRMALWWHDAVYDPRASKFANEFMSGYLARQVCRMMNCDETAAHWVEIHASFTFHGGDPQHPDTKLVCDIDLASLGYEWGTFDRNSRDIRKEYGFVPEDVYRAGRAEILEALLKRDRIYYTDRFHERFEVRARENVVRHVAELRDPSLPVD